MRAAGPRFGLAEVTLGAEAIGVIEGCAFTALQRQQFHVVRRMARGTGGAGLRRMLGPDVLVRVGNPFVPENHAAPQVARRAGILTQPWRTHAR